MEIPGLSDSHVMSTIQQLKQASREQDTSSDNVQILEQVIGECKNQLVTIANEGVWKLQLCSDKEERCSSQKAVRVSEGGMRENSMPNRRGDA